MNFYNFNNFPVVRFWSFFEDPHILTIGTLLLRRIPDGVPIATETRILQMYGAMLANPCHPYIQRGYRPFVIMLHTNLRFTPSLGICCFIPINCIRTEQPCKNLSPSLPRFACEQSSTEAERTMRAAGGALHSQL